MPRLLTKANDGAYFGKHRRQAAEVTSETYRVGHERKEGIRSGGSAGRFQANFKNAGGDERCCAVALRSRESAHTRGRRGTRRFPIPTPRAVRTEACAILPIALRRRRSEERRVGKGVR